VVLALFHKAKLSPQQFISVLLSKVEQVIAVRFLKVELIRRKLYFAENELDEIRTRLNNSKLFNEHHAKCLHS